MRLLTREEFDAILKDEGVLNADCRDASWAHGPFEDDPDTVLAIRKAARMALAVLPMAAMMP